MKVLFVIGQFTVGGVETYVLRVAKALAADGVEVDVWIVKSSYDEALVAQLQTVANVRFLTPKWLPYPLFVWSPALPAGADVVFTTGRLALFFAAMACARARRSARLIAGVFSQWEYVPNRRDMKSRLAHELVEKLGPRNMVFCTEGARADHTAALGEVYRDSLVSPLLVDLPQAKPRPAKPAGRPLQIVSVSRLVNFKTSNTQMPGVVAALNAAGIPAHWTLYGDGPEKEKIAASIAAAGAQGFVSLPGPVPYSELPGVIERADVYVGGGTTLVEASALGVPALVARDSNAEATSPGFFCERAGVFTSDISDDDVLEPFIDHITRFAHLDQAGVDDLSERSRRKAELYGAGQALNEYQAMQRIAEPVAVALPRWFQARYAVATGLEIVRVLLGKDAQPERYGYFDTASG